jgi:hypothetical protein
MIIAAIFLPRSTRAFQLCFVGWVAVLTRQSWPQGSYRPAMVVSIDLVTGASSGVSSVARLHSPQKLTVPGG